MSELSRFSVSAEEELLESFDKLINAQGYSNRSEALRDLMRDALVKSQVETTSDPGEILGSLTLVYDHHANELTEKMNELQHNHYQLVVSVLHVHVNQHDCMEIIALRGKIQEVRALANGLLSLKGVKHGQLFMTLPSQQIVRGRVNSSHHSHQH